MPKNLESQQVQSSPYFQRMMAVSDNREELHRLKQEFDRMRDFNERTIELRLRQVRLKRLFKEINELNERPAVVQYPAAPLKLEDVRRSALLRARELGKEFSRMNSARLPQTQRKQCNAAPKPPKKPKQLLQRLRQKKRAIEYGNQWSRDNRENYKELTLKKSETYQNKSVKMRQMSAEMVRKWQRDLQRHQNRIEYGNTRSSINMARLSAKEAIKAKTLNKQTSNSSSRNTTRKYISPASTTSPTAASTSEIANQNSRSTVGKQQHKAEAVVPSSESTNWQTGALLHLKSSTEPIPLSTTDLKISEPSSQSDISRSDTSARIESDLLAPTISNVVESMYKFEDAEVNNWQGTPTIYKLEGVETEFDILTSESEPVLSSEVQHLVNLFEPIVREAAKKEAFDCMDKLRQILAN